MNRDGGFSVQIMIAIVVGLAGAFLISVGERRARGRQRDDEIRAFEYPDDASNDRPPRHRRET
ncbi:hypothetical protein OG897_32235 [Streptomyces sp. NBC_00237]|uniref:hypothetical protein n=1 Tax=Streptomyces sp. NBC_00237 TaxID=2975687 RepID=UPI0022512D11|nr:hypothetical protein [Streptomyces sp. NBC_00237]MCX5206072.1 hypothetical protein [Streptomyces sp. NBC_00237]